MCIHVPMMSLGSRRAASSSSNINCMTTVFTPAAEAPYENPTPVVLLPGEGLSGKVFDRWVEALRQRGYGGAVVTIPSTLDDPEALGEAIHQTVESKGMVPPLLIAHSVGSHAALTYLQSHGLAGLVLLNPLPVHPCQPASVLASKYSECVATEEEGVGREVGIMSRYYGIRPPNRLLPAYVHEKAQVGGGFPGALMNNLSRHADVSLEPGPVPTLVILTGGDDILYDHKQEQELKNLWAVIEEDGDKESEGQSPGQQVLQEQPMAIMGEGGAVATPSDPVENENNHPSFTRLSYDLSRFAPGNKTALDKTLWWIETFL